VEKFFIRIDELRWLKRSTLSKLEMDFRRGRKSESAGTVESRPDVGDFASTHWGVPFRLFIQRWEKHSRREIIRKLRRSRRRNAVSNIWL